MLTFCYFFAADFRLADLRDANLRSADFENADLRNANLSGANIYYIKTNGWKIDGIKCTHAYQCIWNEAFAGNFPENTRRDFGPGQFEQIYKTLPTIEMIFNNGLSPLDYMQLVGLTNIIQQKNPEMNLQVKAMEKVGLDTILRLTLERDEDLEKAVRLIAQLSRERNLEQKLLPVLAAEGLQPIAPTNYHFHMQGCNVTIAKTGGETISMGDINNIGQITAKDSPIAIGNQAVVNYQAQTTQLLTTLREIISEQQQTLVDVLDKAIKAQDKQGASNALDKIGKGLDVGSKAWSLVKKIGGLLALI